MKKIVFALLIVFTLLAWTLPVAMAGAGYDDPKLCVEGKWLYVDAAAVSAVRVTVPEDSRYGDQRAGGCKTPGLDVPLIQAVVERGEHHLLRVSVDGKNASTPTVTAAYGQNQQDLRNNGKGKLNFTFTVQ